MVIYFVGLLAIICGVCYVNINKAKYPEESEILLWLFKVSSALFLYVLMNWKLVG